jgi:hypothetical protein
MCTGHRIDIHHHYFPASLEKASQNRSVGWRTPTENLPWTPELSLRAMEELGIDIAILSHPPISSGTVGPADRARARANNLFAAKVCEDHPGRFGFFATLPLLDDVEGATATSSVCQRWPLTMRGAVTLPRRSGRDRVRSGRAQGGRRVSCVVLWSRR